MAEMTMEARGTGTTARRLGRNTWQYALVGVLFGAAFPIIATALRISQMKLGLSPSSIVMVQAGDPLLWIIDTAPLFLGLLAGLAGLRQDTLAARNTDLQARERELTALKDGLEQRVSDRTQELAVRNAQLRSAVDLTRELAGIREVSSLSTRSVELFARHFAGYEADIYLVDTARQVAVLQASSSPSQGRNIQDGHAVRVGDASLVGQAALLGRARVGAWAGTADQAPSTATSVPGHREMALPLTARGQTLGVLHMRPSSANVLAEAEPDLLQLLADQLASALDSARLLDEARVSLDQLQAVTGRGTRTGWQDYAGTQGLAFRYTPSGTRPISVGIPVNDDRALRVPLIVRGQQIGSMAFRRGGRQGWSDVDRELVEKAATQVALALDNNRLMDETRQRAYLEQRVGEISDQFSRSIDIDSLLQTAVREIAALPAVSDASVFVSPELTGTKDGDLD